MVTCFPTFWWFELPFLSLYIFWIFFFIYYTLLCIEKENKVAAAAAPTQHWQSSNCMFVVKSVNCRLFFFHLSNLFSYLLKPPYFSQIMCQGLHASMGTRVIKSVPYHHAIMAYTEHTFQNSIMHVYSWSATLHALAYTEYTIAVCNNCLYHMHLVFHNSS